MYLNKIEISNLIPMTFEVEAITFFSKDDPTSPNRLMLEGDRFLAEHDRVELPDMALAAQRLAIQGVAPGYSMCHVSCHVMSCVVLQV